MTFYSRVWLIQWREKQKEGGEAGGLKERGAYLRRGLIVDLQYVWAPRLIYILETNKLLLLSKVWTHESLQK